MAYFVEIRRAEPKILWNRKKLKKTLKKRKKCLTKAGRSGNLCKSPGKSDEAAEDLRAGTKKV